VLDLDDVDILRNVASSFPNDRTHDIYAMFVWANSPQGHNYWSQIANHKQSMTDDDRQFLRDRADFLEDMINSGVQIW
jgi:hypothetical protein